MAFSEEELRKNIPALPDFQSIEITQAEEGHVAFRFVPPASVANFHGNMHGGLVYTLCEIAAGMTASTFGKNNVALNGSINYLRRCELNKALTVETDTSHNGRSTMVHHVRVIDEAEKLIAEANFTLFVLPNDNA